jgi:hypothetical protein
MILPGIVHHQCLQLPQCTGTLDPDPIIVNGSLPFPPI